MMNFGAQSAFSAAVLLGGGSESVLLFTHVSCRRHCCAALLSCTLLIPIQCANIHSFILFTISIIIHVLNTQWKERVSSSKKDSPSKTTSNYSLTPWKRRS